MASYILKISGQIIFDIVYFPVWWYSKGLIELTNWLKKLLIEKEKGLNLSIWIKNIFTPMYKQRDISGVLISFFMRLVQIVFRSIIMFFLLIIVVGIFVFWIFLPIFVIYNLIYQTL